MLVRAFAGEALGSDAYSHLLWARDAVRHGVTSHAPFDYTVPKPFEQGVAVLGTKLGAATFVFEWTSLAAAFACAAAAAALARRLGPSPAAPLAALFALCLPVLWRGGPLGDSNVPYAALVVGCGRGRHRHALVRGPAHRGGPLRPEAWGLAIINAVLGWREATLTTRVLSLVSAFVPPIVWVTLDHVFTGDWWWSSNIVDAYNDRFHPPLLHLTDLPGAVIERVGDVATWPVALLGLASIVIGLGAPALRRRHRLPARARLRARAGRGPRSDLGRRRRTHAHRRWRCSPQQARRSRWRSTTPGMLRGSLAVVAVAAVPLAAAPWLAGAVRDVRDQARQARALEDVIAPALEREAPPGFVALPRQWQGQLALVLGPAAQRVHPRAGDQRRGRSVQGRRADRAGGRAAAALGASGRDHARLARRRADSPLHHLSLPTRSALYAAAVSEEAEKAKAVTMDTIVSLCRRRGFVFPSSEIYGGLGSAYDYAHYGVLMKGNVKAAWLRAMVQERDDIVALDSALMLHPRVWEASGHVGGFSDPMVDCRVCKHRFRADDLDNATCPQKPSSPPGQGPNCDLTEARDFNLMFETTIGPVKESGTSVYLRPETAQGIFINFKNVLQIARRQAAVRHRAGRQVVPQRDHARQLPLPHARVRADGDGVLRPAGRGRDVVPLLGRRARRRGTTATASSPRTCACACTRPPSCRTTRAPRAISSTAIRSAGPSSRASPTAATTTSSSTREFSGTKLEYVGAGRRALRAARDRARGRRRPRVPGLPCDAYDEEEVAGRERVLLRLHPSIAPVKAAILPLLGNDAAQGERAAALAAELRPHFQVELDTSGAIGRRYRRQDEIGTPWAVTIDHESFEDDAVTVRDRDTLEQVRVPIGDVRQLLVERLSDAADRR